MVAKHRGAGVAYPCAAWMQVVFRRLLQGHVADFAPSVQPSVQ